MFEDISKFFKSLFSNKNRKKGNFPVFVAIVCVLVLIPTVFAVFYTYFYEESSYLTANEVQIELYDGSGERIATDKVIEANITDSPLISVFYNLNATKKLVSRPSGLEISPNFKVVFKHRESPEEEFFCYFTDSEENSFLEDKNGSFFSVDKDAYAAFLNSSYSEAAYPESTPPALITGNDESVIPASFQWTYKKKNGRTASATIHDITSDIITYKIGGAVNLHFQRVPDVCSVLLSDAEGKELYSGSLEELPFVTIESGDLLNAKISASWKNGEGVNSFGEVNYEFKISVGDRAQFSLSADELSPSQFVILSAKNVDDISKIIFSLTSQHKLTDFGKDSPQHAALSFIKNFTPTFIHTNNEVRAAIPLPAGTPSGDYELSISFGAEKQIFKLKVNESETSKKSTLNKPFSEISSTVSELAINNFTSTLKKVEAPSRELILFKSPFLSPLDNGFTLGYGYGDTVSATDKEDAFVSLGNEYLANTAGGASVPALNTGVVVATGYSAHLGNYVTIDHGLGIRTWYCALASIDVEIGDALAKGESVGKCGVKGLVSGSGTVILCSVYDCLIDPDFVIGKDIKY